MCAQEFRNSGCAMSAYNVNVINTHIHTYVHVLTGSSDAAMFFSFPVETGEMKHKPLEKPLNDQNNL